MKRLFDLAVSLGLLLVATPVIALAAVLVKVTSRGPVLYTQERVGQHGRPIVIRKFRSMTVSANGDTEWTADARVTLVGRWLRRLNIDELPQLYSVVRGDMSLVGPRPERPLFVKRFASTIADYDDRHRMPVGITGLAQIVGLRGDTSIAERIKYDNLYIDQWSFGADLQILARTVSAILQQKTTTRHAIELEEALEEGAVGPGTDRLLGLVEVA
ncbi:MAG: sugar transferase [Actinomycetia bacterium]|nr:sugar transferase [Actinomycetes bacterium]